jgi:hypothetical protein
MRQHYKHTSCKGAIRRRNISVANAELQITEMQGSRMRLALSGVSQLRNRDASYTFPGPSLLTINCTNVYHIRHDSATFSDLLSSGSYLVLGEDG